MLQLGLNLTNIDQANILFAPISVKNIYQSEFANALNTYKNQTIKKAVWMLLLSTDALGNINLTLMDFK